MNIWVKSNYQFIKGHLILSALKVISNVLGIFFFAYFWGFKSEEFLILANVGLAILTGIVMVTLISYGLIQKQSLSLRMREMFVWKWYGLKKSKLFWMFFMEHFFIVSISGILTLVLFDAFNLMMTNFGLTFSIGQVDVIVPVLITMVLMMVFGIAQIIFTTKMDKVEVFNKISLQIRDNL